MRGNGFDDEENTPTEGIAVMGHSANREVLAFLANDVTELKQHTRVILTLYEMMKTLTFPCGPVMRGQLVEEYERHQKASDTNLILLRAVASGRR